MHIPVVSVPISRGSDGVRPWIRYTFLWNRGRVEFKMKAGNWIHSIHTYLHGKWFSEIHMGKIIKAGYIRKVYHWIYKTSDSRCFDIPGYKWIVDYLNSNQRFLNSTHDGAQGLFTYTTLHLILDEFWIGTALCIIERKMFYVVFLWSRLFQLSTHLQNINIHQFGSNGGFPVSIQRDSDGGVQVRR